jgi:hypothetical protein
MSRLLASLDAPPSGRQRAVWFDAAAYGRARLLGGDVPWAAPAELSSFFAKIGAMFRPDAILIDVADIMALRAAADPVPGVALWLGPAAPGQPTGRWGVVAGPDFWDGADPPAEAGLVLAVVSAEADPEALMKRVRALT